MQMDGMFGMIYVYRWVKRGSFNAGKLDPFITERAYLCGRKRLVKTDCVRGLIRKW